MSTAAVYARVSTERQKKDQTIASQVAGLLEYAKQNRLEVPAGWVFCDEACRGAALDRPGLEALRDLAAQGCIDVVLVHSPDRLARKLAWQALLIEELARSGTRVQFLNGPRGDSPEDQMLAQFQGIFAEYERAQIAERNRRGKAHKARSGYVSVLSRAPYGYRYIPRAADAGAQYQIIEHEAALAAGIFGRYADGATLADLARWLHAQGARTRTGKTHWDRAVIAGMLRNPAYAGTAAFGKTRIIPGPAALTRPARLQGRTPRAFRKAARPREEWAQIPVPAIVSRETFDRVQQRLEDNKRFAARNTKVPSLLTGLAACAACGYGYHRTTSRVAGRQKIYHYYRCSGRDSRQHEGIQACPSKPVRADYLDAVVWDHITGLLADPALIHAEISRRLEQARTSDPVTRQRQQLEQALAKAGTSVTAMIEAYSEQLITIDELRARLPHLRARQATLRAQLHALDTQAADRDACLTLAGDIDTFLTQLRASAATASIPERQRVLRLLVQDVLIGPDKITIRHRIPVREPAGSGGGRHDTTDTEGDMRQSYPLCWGRNHSHSRTGSRTGTASGHRPRVTPG